MAVAAQVSSQRRREGLRDASTRLRLLEKKQNALALFSSRWGKDVNLTTGGYLAAAVADQLQQGALQQQVDPVGGEQVLGLRQLPQGEQQRLRQHQEAHPRSGATALLLLLLRRRRQLLQLDGETKDG